jgi:2-keto-4-pentenoate hydratase
MEFIDQDMAARLLADAAATGRPLAALPAAGKPSTAAEALAIQELLVGRSQQAVKGWKVATDAAGTASWGAIFAADCFATPASVDGSRLAPMGVEGEIAFSFDRNLPSRAEPYSRAEIEAVLTAFATIEIVSSRFASYQDTPRVDRIADRMSNGGIVMGALRQDWRGFDLSKLRVTLSVDGVVTVDRIGGHDRGDPLLPALEFIRAVQATKSFQAGQFITTGSFTGLTFGQPGARFAVEFQHFGKVELAFR